MSESIDIRHTGSLVNAIYRQTPALEPVEGMGVTILLWTDRHAGTIELVSESKKRIHVSRDKAIRTDNNGMSEHQTYTYERGNAADTDRFTLRKNGRWVRYGESMQSGTALLIGKREEYHDYAF